MGQQYITFGAPRYSEEEILDVVDSMEKGWIGTGPKVTRLEKAFAHYLGVEDCVAVNSCTAALHLSLLEAGIGPGDEVITTAMTFCSTINVIIHVGATPVLADISLEDWNLTPDSVRNKISGKTKALLVVHFAGRPCDMWEMRKIADQNNLILIEDCAHAIETRVSNRHVGTFGDFSAFSFYSTKNISSGEGGIIVTNRGGETLNRIRQRALHGLDKDAFKRFSSDGKAEYDVNVIGYKYNMMDLNAAIAFQQLKRVDEWHQRRKQIWGYYQSELTDLPLLLPSPPNSNTTHAYHLFQILLRSNDEPAASRRTFRKKLHEFGVGSGIHYKPIAEFSIYKELFSWDSTSFPNSQYFGSRTVSIPISPHLADHEVERIVNAVKGALEHV
jgi:dTDP-4-amino-4,6-dideoxygalactose transaminase